MADFKPWICRRADGCQHRTLAGARTCQDYIKDRPEPGVRPEDVGHYAVAVYPTNGSNATVQANAMVPIGASTLLIDNVGLQDKDVRIGSEFVAPKTGSHLIVGTWWSNIGTVTGVERFTLRHVGLDGLVKNDYPNFLVRGMWLSNYRILYLNKDEKLSLISNVDASYWGSPSHTELRVISI
jgi:hypothetical protein